MKNAIKSLICVLFAAVLTAGCKAIPSVSPSPTVSTDQQQYKTYSQENFSVEYPSSWQLEKNEDRVTFKAPGSAMVSITESEAAPGLSASTFELNASDAIEKAISATGAKAVCIYKGVKTVGTRETYNILIETEDNDGKTIEIEQYYFFREKSITLMEFYYIKGAKPQEFSNILASYREK